MSLKKFVQNKEVREMLKETFFKPKIEYSKDIKAKAYCSNTGIIGTAFDYLLRFYVERINEGRVVSGLLLVEQMVPYLHDDLRTEAIVQLKMLKESKEEFMRIKGLNDELIITLLQISHFDIMYRSKTVDYFPDDIGKVDIDAILEMKELYKLLDENDWKCSQRCVLNPHFEKASLLVNGADADIILDDMLVDIKVIQQPGMSREIFNQLLGYYTLYRIGGFDKDGRFPINRVAIYSARYGEFLKYDIESLMSNNTYSDFEDNFICKAKELYNHSDKFIEEVRSMR